MLIPDPQFPLPEDAAAFRDALNSSWAALQDRRAALVHRRAELDAAAPETMDKNHIRRLKELKAQEADVMRQELPLLRQAAERWPGMLKAAYIAHVEAVEAEYNREVAAKKNLLTESGWHDAPGYVTLWFFSHQNVAVRAARVALWNAQQKRQQLDTGNLEYLLSNLEAELRRAVDAAA